MNTLSVRSSAVVVAAIIALGYALLFAPSLVDGAKPQPAVAISSVEVVVGTGCGYRVEADVSGLTGPVTTAG